MGDIVLYGTSACHLCDVAEQLLRSVLSGMNYTKCDITISQELFEKYGEVILAQNSSAQIVSIPRVNLWENLTFDTNQGYLEAFVKVCELLFLILKFYLKFQIICW